MIIEDPYRRSPLRTCISGISNDPHGSREAARVRNAQYCVTCGCPNDERAYTQTVMRAPENTAAVAVVRGGEPRGEHPMRSFAKPRPPSPAVPSHPFLSRSLR
jgi:hypothetical protein